jgi:hypothetical protein
MAFQNHKQKASGKATAQGPRPSSVTIPARGDAVNNGAPGPTPAPTKKYVNPILTERVEPTGYDRAATGTADAKRPRDMSKGSARYVPGGGSMWVTVSDVKVLKRGKHPNEWSVIEKGWDWKMENDGLLYVKFKDGPWF